jgi:hypothetical protein
MKSLDSAPAVWYGLDRRATKLRTWHLHLRDSCGAGIGSRQDEAIKLVAHACMNEMTHKGRRPA